MTTWPLQGTRKTTLNWWRRSPPVLSSLPSTEQKMALLAHFASDAELSTVEKNVAYLLQPRGSNLLR